MTEEFRSDGASEESVGPTEEQSSAMKISRRTLLSMAGIAGMSVLFLPRKPLPAESVDTPGELVFPHPQEKGNFIPKIFYVKSLDNKRVPVSFLEDGFTLRVGEKIFQMQSLTAYYVAFTLQQMKVQVPDRTVSIRYDGGLLFQSLGNTLGIPKAGVRQIITALHRTVADQTVCGIDNVPFTLNVPDNVLLPTKGVMSVALKHEMSHDRLTAHST